MKLITKDSTCIYYGNAEHSFVNDILVCEDVNYGDCHEDNVQIHNDITAPDDFTLLKYDYVNDEFVVSKRYLDFCEEKRTERDALLAETDWWSCSDRTMTQAEIDYRQALRDIPQQEGFPTHIIWPTKP